MVATTRVSGKKLVELREANFLTREALAQRGAMKVSGLQRIEQAREARVTFTTMQKLSKGLDLPVEKLAKLLSPAMGGDVVKLEVPVDVHAALRKRARYMRLPNVQALLAWLASHGADGTQLRIAGKPMDDNDGKRGKGK